MQITTQQHIIIFTDGSKKEVTEELALKVIQASTTEQTGMTISGSYYKFTMIAKVLDMAEYYRQYPEKKPESNLQEFPDTGLQFYERSDTRKGALNGIIKGLKQYILNQKGETPSADALLMDVEKRLAKLKN